MLEKSSATELLFQYLVQRADTVSDMTTKILIPDTLVYKYLHLKLCVDALNSNIGISQPRRAPSFARPRRKFLSNT